MAGSIEANLSAYKKQTFNYIPPTPPSHLIDTTSFILHFDSRKFLHVGLDVQNNFEIAVNIITPSRYVSVSTDLLKRLFSLMGNILSFILDQPHEYKRTIFLETECYTLSSMVYRGENVLVIESKIRKGCRVLLHRSDLLSLQYMEWSIFEAITQKTEIVRPMVLKQVDHIIAYINNVFIYGDKTMKNISDLIKQTRDDLLSEHVNECQLNLVSQIKLFAADQVAQRLIKVLYYFQLKF